MGDPAGGGPELCLRALADSGLREVCAPVVFGDAAVLARVAEICRLPPAPAGSVVNLDAITAEDVTPGAISAACGAAAYRYITAAIDAALAGEVDAICTAPIHKEALRAAGVDFPGHTEILAARTHTKRYCMMLTAEELTCSLVTTHIGYRDVPAALSTARVLEVITLTADAMRRLRGREPRLVVCGLNPHAGERGLFGDGEEERIIAPAVAAARTQGVTVTGPLPPDTAFTAARRRETDAYVCMYHDQGLIPLKALAFEDAVNVTLGLPIVRTSVDHGTAFDIAWQGRASARSLLAAVRLAARLAR
jgi:4-hydroxythreonine-4-phosphate dehydrogenase